MKIKFSDPSSECKEGYINQGVRYYQRYSKIKTMKKKTYNIILLALLTRYHGIYVTN